MEERGVGVQSEAGVGGSLPFRSTIRRASVAAGSFAMIELLPVNFNYWAFGLLLLLNGLAMSR